MKTGQKIILYISAAIGVCSAITYLFATLLYGKFAIIDLIASLTLGVSVSGIAAVILDFLTYHTVGKAYFFDFSKITIENPFETDNFSDEEQLYQDKQKIELEESNDESWRHDPNNAASFIYQVFHNRFIEEEHVRPYQKNFE